MGILRSALVGTCMAVGLTASAQTMAQSGPTIGVSWASFQEERWRTDEAAMVAVIEAAVDWPLGKGILDRLLDIPGMQVRASIGLDLSANPGMDPDHYRRRLLVLSPEPLHK